jgi:DNA polymerase
MTNKNKLKCMEELKTIAKSCKKCDLHRDRKNVVFGEGNIESKLVFIGEAPGYLEDKTGRPFVGASGKLLNKMLEEVNISRKDVYICNIVMCRPKNNRRPFSKEFQKCHKYLLTTLLLIKPKIIVTLGKTAISVLLKKNIYINRYRGGWKKHFKTPVFPTFHPAYVLRNTDKRDIMLSDFKRIKAVYDTLSD